MSITFLTAKQNPDGGWPYLRGGSWTEPTVWAVLALSAAGETACARRGVQWLSQTQLSDGGWPSRPGAGESSWVTALAALLPEESLGAERHRHAIEWLIGATGEESTFVYRLRERLLGLPRPAAQKHPGWPWTPGAAAWVTPTSVAILCLEKELRRRQSAAAGQRIAEGREFLLARMCRQGGWNHGGLAAYGYEASPYPETTGMALAALRGVRSPKVDRALDVARGYLFASHSADAQNWLQMGLRAHGQLPAGYRPPDGIPYRSVPDVALHSLSNTEFLA